MADELTTVDVVAGRDRLGIGSPDPWFLEPALNAFVFPSGFVPDVLPDVLPEVVVRPAPAPVIPPIPPGLLAGLSSLAAGVVGFFFSPPLNPDELPGTRVAPEYQPPELEPLPEVIVRPATPTRIPFDVPELQPGVTISLPRVGTVRPFRDPLDDFFRDPFADFVQPMPAGPAPQVYTRPGEGTRGDPASPDFQPFANPQVVPFPDFFPDPWARPFSDPSTETRPTTQPRVPTEPALPSPFLPGDPVFFAPPIPSAPRAPLRIPTLTPFDDPSVDSAPEPSNQARPDNCPPCVETKEKKPKRKCERGFYRVNASGDIKYTPWSKKCPQSKSNSPSRPQGRSQTSSTAARSSTRAVETFSPWEWSLP